MVFKPFNRKVNPPNITPEISPEVLTPKSFRKNVDRHSIVLGIKQSSQVRLGVEMNLFTREGNSVPIVNVFSGAPFHDLQVRGKVSDNDVVLEEAATKTPVAVVRHNTAKDTFMIYSTRPVYTGQMPADVFKYNQRLYTFAEVKRRGKVLNVIVEGQSAPTYTIHNHKMVSHPSSQFPMTYVIKKLGEEVAYTRWGEGRSYAVLTVKPGVDPCLMICLAAITEEANK